MRELEDQIIPLTDKELEAKKRRSQLMKSLRMPSIIKKGAEEDEDTIDGY